MLATRLAFIITRLVMGVAAILLNLLTMLCVLKNKVLRSSAHVLVTALALVDFLHGGLTAIVLPLKEFLPSWHLSHPWCIAGLCLELITTSVQFVTLALLSLERRNSLLYQLNRGKKWSCKTITLILAIVWTVIIAYNVAVTIALSDVSEGEACRTPAALTYIGAALFIASLCVITGGYGHIAWVAYKSKLQAMAAETPAQQENRKKDMRITKMMALVVGVYFALYTPVVITSLTSSKVTPTWRSIMFYVSILIYDINFWVNPFIYAWRDKNFSKELKKGLASCCSMCHCWFRGPQVAPIEEGAVEMNAHPTGAAARATGSTSTPGGIVQEGQSIRISGGAPSGTGGTTLTNFVPRDPCTDRF